LGKRDQFWCTWFVMMNVINSRAHGCPWVQGVVDLLLLNVLP
jgi:hypothetical protein